MGDHAEEPAHRLAGPVGARPAQLVEQDLAPSHRRQAALHQVIGEDHPVPFSPGAVGDLVIVGQVVGQRLKAPDGLQDLPSGGDGGPEGEAHPQQAPPYQNGGQILGVDQAGFHQGRPGGGLAGDVQAGDHAHPPVQERRDHPPQVIRADAHVLVGQHQEVVAGVGPHLEHLADLGVDCPLLVTDNRRHLAPVVPLAGRRQAQGGGVLRPGTEHNLKARIVLLAKGAHVVAGGRVPEGQRLEHRNGRQVSGRGRRVLPDELPGLPQRQDVVEQRHGGEEGGDVLQRGERWAERFGHGRWVSEFNEGGASSWPAYRRASVLRLIQTSSMGRRQTGAARTLPGL